MKYEFHNHLEKQVFELFIIKQVRENQIANLYNHHQVVMLLDLSLYLKPTIYS